MDYTDLLDCLPRYFDLLLLDTTQNVSHRKAVGAGGRDHAGESI